jgi:hypothetical protein
MSVPHRKHTCGPPRPLMGIALLLLFFIGTWCSYLTGNTWASTACYSDSITFTNLYISDVLASQETHLWASTACYSDSFTFTNLYISDVRASQETHLWASRACYGDSFTFTEDWVTVSREWLGILRTRSKCPIISEKLLSRVRPIIVVEFLALA